MKATELKNKGVKIILGNKEYNEALSNSMPGIEENLGE